MSKYKEEKESNYLHDIFNPRTGAGGLLRSFQNCFEENDDKKDAEPPDEMQLKMADNSGIFFGVGKTGDVKIVMERETTAGDFIDKDKGIDGRFALNTPPVKSHIKNPISRYVGKAQNIDGHVAVIGGTGSGKGTCIAIPTMRSWKNPMVVLDIKGDLYSQWIKMENATGRPAKVFNPSMPDTYTYDPFSYIRKKGEESNRPSNVRELVNAMIPMPLDTHDRFWITAARKILTGALLYYLEQGLDFYPAINNITGCPIVDILNEINNSRNPKDMAAQKYIRAFKDKKNLADSKMLLDINETLDTYLMEFTNDKRIEKALTPSDKSSNPINWETDLDDLDDHKSHNIFLTIPEDKIDQWAGVLNVMITQLIRTLERRPEKYSTDEKKHPHVLLLLDETPRVGKIDALANALSTLRSKNVTVSIFAQSVYQLDSVYGTSIRRIMLDNCNYKAVLRVTDAESQKYFSELAGTVSTLSRSFNASLDLDMKLIGASESYNESRKPFIYPHEFAKLDKELLLFSPHGTFRIVKAPYHEWKPGTFFTE